MKPNEIERKVDNLISPQKRSRRGKRMKRKMLAVIAVIVSCLVITASATLLTYYGQVTTTANVSQSVLIDGNDYTTPITHEFGIIAGCTQWIKHKIENRACVEAPIDVSETGIVEGITVSYYILPGTLSLILENKDASWNIINDGYQVELTFNPCCPNFEWTLEGKVTQTEKEYVLIYYADQPDRFVNWGGAPALELARVTSDVNGDISDSGSKNLGACFPFETDWNIGPNADYHAYDGYDHAKGAKIWLIPTSDYNGIDEVLSAWNPGDYMFETDLVAYFDCDIEYPTSWVLTAYFNNNYGTTFTFPYTMNPKSEICLFVKYSFNVAIVPGTYIITSQFQPTPTP